MEFFGRPGVNCLSPTGPLSHRTCKPTYCRPGDPVTISALLLAIRDNRRIGKATVSTHISYLMRINFNIKQIIIGGT
jgi:hypothetical protein